MSELKTVVLECAGCTAPLSEAIMAKGIHKCPYCGYVNILPKEEQSSEVLHHLRNADTELKNGEFERAYNEYFEASKLDGKESKAYFGMALATNRVKHVKDVVNNRWQAICCEVTEKKFADDTNYKKALKYATEEQRVEYTQRADEIDYIREKFVELENSGLAYDTFICVKVSDGNGGFTQDSVWAGKLYDNIKKAGMRPFYSEREIGDRTGEDYEALILYALYSSKSMLVVCSNEDYLRTPWVQNEYTRYYSMMSENDKQKNSIMIAFSENVVERIPGIPGKMQGVELHSFDASQKINEFVSKFANAEERARKEAEKKARAEAERQAEKDAEKKAREDQQKALEEQQKMLLELQKKLLEKDEKPQYQPTPAPAYTGVQYGGGYGGYADQRAYEEEMRKAREEEEKQERIRLYLEKQKKKKKITAAIIMAVISLIVLGIAPFLGIAIAAISAGIIFRRKNAVRRLRRTIIIIVVSILVLTGIIVGGLAIGGAFDTYSSSGYYDDYYDDYYSSDYWGGYDDYYSTSAETIYEGQTAYGYSGDNAYTFSPNTSGYYDIDFYSGSYNAGTVYIYDNYGDRVYEENNGSYYFYSYYTYTIEIYGYGSFQFSIEY